MGHQPRSATAGYGTGARRTIPVRGAISEMGSVTACLRKSARAMRQGSGDLSRAPPLPRCAQISGGPCQKMHPRERGATPVAAAVTDARRSHHPDEAAKAHLNNSSWLPVRSKKATLSFDDQITSQSPEFATWHSLLPAQLPESRCILCRRRRISMDSGEFSRTRSKRLWSSTRSQLRRWAFFLRSRENAAENSAVNLPISASPLR